MKNLCIILTFTFLSCFSSADHITPEEQALFTKQAEDFFDDTLQKLYEIGAEVEKITITDNDSEKINLEPFNKINKIFKQVIDLETISKYIIGEPTYKTMTEEQKKEYKDLSYDFITSTYTFLTILHIATKRENIHRIQSVFFEKKKVGKF